jgi:hypothetical protein
MTALQGLGLVSPRAAAHVWGKRARILTEINRITQPAFSTPAKSDGIASLAGCQKPELRPASLQIRSGLCYLDEAGAAFDARDYGRSQLFQLLPALSQVLSMQAP